MPAASSHGPTLTADEFRAALASFGFTQQGFAAALGYSGKTGQRWAAGDTVIPGAVAVIVRLLLARPEQVSVLAEIAPMPKAARKSNAGRKPAKRAVSKG